MRVVLRPCAVAAYLKKVFKPGLATDDNGARGIRAMHRFAALALALALLAVAGCASPPRTDPGAVAAAYAAEGRLDEASREIEIAVRTHPKDLALRRQAAEIYERAGNVDKAVSHLEDSIEIAPDDAETWIRLAELENGRGNIDDAYVAYRRAEKLAPDDVRAVSGLALTADSLGFTRRGAARLRALVRAREERAPAGEPPPRD